MKNKALWMILLAVAFTVFPISDVKATEKTITMDLTDMTVQAALESILDKAEVNYVLKEGITGRIDKLSFRSVDFRTALDSILQTSNLIYEITDGIYIISPKDPPKKEQPRIATAYPRTPEPSTPVQREPEPDVAPLEIPYMGEVPAVEPYYQPYPYYDPYFSVPIRPYYISPPYQYQFMTRHHLLPPAPWRRMPRVNGVPIFW